MSLDRLRQLERRLQEHVARGPETNRPPWTLAPELGRQLLESMLLARHLDLAAHELSQSGQGVYTIASSGHEANVVLGHLTLPSDPAMVHYRSGALFLERARHVAEVDRIVAILAEEAASGDVITVMSNGAFGGLHEKLLRALGARESEPETA